MRAFKSFLLVIALAVAVSPASAQVPTFDAFYAFGDSLADSGNVFLATQQLFPTAIPPSQTYFDGRFSNGLNAFDYLWNGLSQTTLGLRPFLESPSLDGTDAVSFAFGGSGTDFVNNSPGGFPVIGLKGQVTLFAAGLGGRRPSPNALYGIISGANDYIQQDPLAPSEVVGNIVQSIQFLYFLGARNVIVLNLPDLGKLPLTVCTPQSAFLTQRSIEHNHLLAKKLRQLGHLPGLNLIPVDVNAILGALPPCGPEALIPALAAIPGLGGLPAASCLFTDDPSTCPDATAYFNLTFQQLPFAFWDVEHPTTAVHCGLAQFLYGRLTSSVPPECLPIP